MKTMSYQGGVCIIDELEGMLKDSKLAKRVYGMIGNDPFTVETAGVGLYILNVNGGIDSHHGYEIRAGEVDGTMSINVIRRIEK
jgi:hypothetical protein